MNIKTEIDLIIAAVNGILKIIEAFDPNAENNPVVIELQKLIETLQKLGV